MTFQDRISIFITFIAGLLLGSYIYVVGFVPTYGLPEAATSEEYADLVIVSDSYGECALTKTCLSFQLLQDGSYRAIVNGEPFEGVVGRQLKNRLIATVTADSLTQDALPLAFLECRYGAEGTNYSFLITVGGKNYALDTCKTRINYEGAAWSALTDLWGEVAADMP
jgi:hypothetical protein